MRHQIHKRCEGFTLVELIVVIGIITVMIAMLLPALGKARAQAESVQCLSNLRQIAIGAAIYSGQNKGWLLSSCENWMPEHMGKTVVYDGPGCAWLDDIFFLLGKNVQYLECPSQRQRRRTDAHMQMVWPYGPREYYPGYFINSAVRTQYFNTPAGPQWPSGYKYYPTQGLKLVQFKQPARKIWFGDSGMGLAYDAPPAIECWRSGSSTQWWHARVQSSDRAMLSGRHGKLGTNQKFYATAYSTPPLMTAGGRGNVVFFDGHAETVDCLEVWPDLGLTYNSTDPIYGRYWDSDGDGCPGTPEPRN